MILKNNRYPRGIDMGPSQAPRIDGGGYSSAGLSERDTGFEAQDDASKAQRDRRRGETACPICGSTALNSRGTACVKNVGPYLGPDGLMPAAKFNAGSGGFKGEDEHWAAAWASIKEKAIG